MTEPLKETTALLIEYNYGVEDWDACRGSRTLHFTDQALLVEFDGRKAMVAYFYGNGFLFPIKVEADGAISYGAVDFNTPLPKNVSDYKVVKEVEIEKKLAKDIVEAAELIDKVFDARRRATSFLLKLRE
ncbi:MAG: hypothetical protein Q8R12_03470 [bacterium]|nr:hypothetical protein [bacterium]